MLIWITKSLHLPANPASMVLLFFVYSFFGYIMECIVLTIEKKHLVVNRGFVRHLPFCIIYGFGAMAGFLILRPISHNLVILFLLGAVGATLFELATARLQIFMFGDFWWDYTKKPFNYKGILCLESTIGWGLLAILLVRFFHPALAGVVKMMPEFFMGPLAAILVLGYALDFIVSAREALMAKKQQAKQADEKQQAEALGE
ncbi:MAG: putative ABC transporter permease [Oscillospiraceae bacterium]